MRYLPLIAVLATLAFAPVANAAVIDRPMHDPVQNLSSPDAQDANAAKDAQSLQDLIKQHAGPHYRALSHAELAALAQEQYYGSYGKAAQLHRATPAHDDTPWDTIAAGLVLIAVVGVAVGIAVRSRQRVRVRAA